jgi:hypothetical protein
MSRLDREAISASLVERIGASPDPDGGADLVAKQGLIAIAATSADVGPAIARLKALPGYRWIAINGGDLFGVSPKTIGTKIGIIDSTGKVLKAADLPRPKA